MAGFPCPKNKFSPITLLIADDSEYAITLLIADDSDCVLTSPVVLQYCFHVDCILGRVNPLQRTIDMNHCANDEEGQLSRRHASRHS